MSDVMLYGILSMPYEMAMSDELSRFQFYKTVQRLLEKDSQQQAEIERLSNDNYKFINAMAKKDSHIESLKQLLNDSALRTAQEK